MLGIGIDVLWAARFGVAGVCGATPPRASSRSRAWSLSCAMLFEQLVDRGLLALLSRSPGSDVNLLHELLAPIEVLANAANYAQSAMEVAGASASLHSLIFLSQNQYGKLSLLLAADKARSGDPSRSQELLSKWRWTTVNRERGRA